MKCPRCGIEMKRQSAHEWVCRNPRCGAYQKEKETNDGKQALRQDP